MTEQVDRRGAGPVVRGARHPVELVLPCPGCTHAAICRIKPALEEATATLSLPAFDSGITIPGLTLSLKCEYRSGPRAKRSDMATKSGGVGWSPEQRAAAAERMRARNKARAAK